MQKLRFLHLSDLHIAGKYEARYKRNRFLAQKLSVYSRNALTAIAEIVYNWRDNLDAIIISGDMAVTGAESDLSRAIEFFNTPANVLPELPWLNNKRQPTIQFFKRPVIVVPGNHDRYKNIAGWPGRLFDYHFSSYWNVGFGGIKYSLLPSATSPVLAIICVDFSLRKATDCSEAFGHWGQGRVYKDQLKELKKRTKVIAKEYPKCPQVWMIHFAPNFEKHDVDFNKKLMLIGSDELLSAAEEVGVNNIFCGHTHLSALYRPRKQVAIHCAGTSCCTDSEAKIHLRDITVKNGQILRISSLDLSYFPSRLTYL